MHPKISKPVQYALDALGIILLIALVYAVGRCTGIDGFAFAQEPVAQAERNPAERLRDAQERQAQQEAMELEQTRHTLEMAEARRTTEAAPGPRVSTPNPADQVPLVTAQPRRYARIAAAPPEPLALPVIEDEPGMSGSIQEGFDWTPLEVALGKIAVNEESFREAGASAIAQARGHYSLEQLQSMHRRALAVGRTDSRRWIEGLNADATMPEGWPEERVPWATRGRPAWLRTLAAIRATNAGEMSTCARRPQVWGGTMDSAGIARLVARGARVVPCPGAANTYLEWGAAR